MNLAIIVLFHKVIFTLFANDRLTTDALADLQRDPIAHYALHHERHFLDFCIMALIGIEMHLRPAVELLEQLLGRDNEHLALFLSEVTAVSVHYYCFCLLVCV